ncbi:ficolin-2-like [Zophobas morio]|uniref:ficolin-2-like n=1 Tax=Zophobas morio TaxID=2755281 RepID=UPI003082C686
MDLKLHLSLIAALFTLSANSEQNEDRKFAVISTTASPHSPTDKLIFDDQLEIRQSLATMKDRLERFEVRMTQIQRALEKLLKLHGVKLERDITATVDSSDLSKIGKVVEEALKLYKTCGNASGQVEDKLQQIKDDLVNEIEKKRNEPTKFSAADLEGFKRDVLNGVSSDVEAARKAIDGFESKLESTNDRLERVTKKVGGVDDDSTISPTGGEFARNCREVLKQGNTKSGIYTIRPPRASQPFKVQCDMDTRGGGWTYVMRRFDGSQDFYLNWTDYKDGFGNLEGEFWLGLKHLHELTGTKPNELLFVLTDWDDKTVYSHFKKFSVGNEEESYLIKVIQGYSGDGGVSFTSHLNWRFNTLDKQDTYGSCVETYHGPWWYGPGCFHVKLTGKYLKGEIKSFGDGIHYSEFHGYRYSLKEVKMLVKI